MRSVLIALSEYRNNTLLSHRILYQPSWQRILLQHLLHNTKMSDVHAYVTHMLT